MHPTNVTVLTIEMKVNIVVLRSIYWLSEHFVYRLRLLPFKCTFCVLSLNWCYNLANINSSTRYCIVYNDMCSSIQLAPKSIKESRSQRVRWICPEYSLYEKQSSFTSRCLSTITKILNDLIVYSHLVSSSTNIDPIAQCWIPTTATDVVSSDLSNFVLRQI